MSDKTATTDHPIHPMLASRWSPRAFSPAARQRHHRLDVRGRTLVAIREQPATVGLHLRGTRHAGFRGALRVPQGIERAVGAQRRPSRTGARTPGKARWKPERARTLRSRPSGRAHDIPGVRPGRPRSSDGRVRSCPSACGTRYPAWPSWCPGLTRLSAAGWCLGAGVFVAGTRRAAGIEMCPQHPLIRRVEAPAARQHALA